MTETALYNRDYPNREIASGNPYESYKHKVCLFQHPHYNKFLVNFRQTRTKVPWIQENLLPSCLPHFWLKHKSASPPQRIKDLVTATKTTIQLPCSVMINIGKIQGLHQELRRARGIHWTHYQKIRPLIRREQEDMIVWMQRLWLCCTREEGSAVHYQSKEWTQKKWIK